MIIRRILGGIICCLFLQSIWAQDTDIFLKSPTRSTDNPNILFIIDNSANWAGTITDPDGTSLTKFEMEVRALQTMLSSITDVNVGLMLSTKQGRESGGYIRYGISPDLSSLSTLVSNLNINSDKTSGDIPYGKMLFEAFKYFGGGDTLSVLPSELGPEQYGTEAYIGHREALRDLTAFNGDSYKQPMTDSCQKNYIIIISNGSPPTNSDSYGEVLLGNVGGNSTSIQLNSSRSESSMADEYARFLSSTDVNPLPGQQNIITYTIAVYKDPISGQDPSNVELMKSTAAQGNGRYFAATSSADLKNALTTILNEIQAVDSVFASVTLPVSVNVRGTNLNQVYLGVFRPDGNNLPLWDGNLKQYQLNFDDVTNNIFLADKNGNQAESLTTGFIVSDAVSFWTTSSNYWAFDPSGNPLSASDSPDGSVVEKGGVAQQLREEYATSQTSRNVYNVGGSFLSSGNLLSNNKFNTTDINTNDLAVVSRFGAADKNELEDIINWTRGQDNIFDENIDGSFTDIRSTVHGDVLHSRPVVVNYNRDGSDDDIVVFYGSNDGLFRAVKGGRKTDSGSELWSVVFEEFHPDLKRYRDNNVSSSIVRRPIFADGSVSVYQKDVNGDGKIIAANGDKAYIYVTMRRGGRFIYAIDVSDPSAPRFLWHKDHTDSGFSELGETWSKLELATIKYTTDPVLFFGAGYDANIEDDDPIDLSKSRTMGRGIFAINGLNGNIIWQAGRSPSGGTYTKSVSDMKYAIPSDVTIIDRDNDNYHDRLYVGDTGGQVWRVKINDPDPSKWEVIKLATLGYDENPSINHNRKFLFAPDVVLGSNFDSIIIGSGDREHPFNGLGTTDYPLSEAVYNRFYVIKDYGNNTTIRTSDLYDATNNAVQDGSGVQRSSAQTLINSSDGMYISLEVGEKVISTPITLSGTIFFNTNKPTGDSSLCFSSLGEARKYRLSYTDLSSTVDANNDGVIDIDDRYTDHAGGGYLPSPVPIIIEIDGEIQEAICSGVSCEKVTTNPLNARYRTFYSESID